MRVLVVDDDPMVARWIDRVLSEEGYAVDVAPSSRDARALGSSTSYDLVIVDLHLPDGSGLGVVQALRAAGRTMPIVIMTGYSDDEGIIAGLDAGADDYLVKPVSNGVLRARLRAALRRGGSLRSNALVVGGLVLDRLRRTVHAGPQPIDLTPKEFALLEDFMLRPEQVVARTDLLERVWGMRFDAGTNVVDATISRLRQKLEGATRTPRIRNARGIGFVLTSEP